MRAEHFSTCVANPGPKLLPAVFPIVVTIHDGLFFSGWIQPKG